MQVFLAKKVNTILKNLQTIKTEKGLEQREPSYTTCNNVNSPWRTAWRFLKKLKIKLPYNLAIPFLGIYPRKNIIQKHKCTPLFTAVLFTIARTWKQPKCPSTEEQIRRMWYIYIKWNITQPIKNEILSFAATCMDIEIVILSEVSQREKDKYMILLIHGSSKKAKDELIYK